MAIDVQRTLDFGNARKAINLPDPVAAQDAATKAYVDSAVEGLGWKASCRVSTQANINLAAPGASVDGVTMAAGDRVLVRAQTAAAENGIYVWNGAALAMARALDANAAIEMEQAVTTIEQGTSAGVTYRQSAVGITLETTALVWVVFGSGSGPASETSAGVLEIATQAETDAGVDDARAVTPAKLAGSVFRARRFAVNVGDGAATAYAVSHNMNTRDVMVEVYRNSGNYDTVLAEVQRTSSNIVTILFDVAPAANAFRVVVHG